MIYVTIWAILATIGFGISRYRNVLLARSARKSVTDLAQQVRDLSVQKADLLSMHFRLDNQQEAFREDSAKTIENLHQIEIRQTLELLQLRDLVEAQDAELLRNRATIAACLYQIDQAGEAITGLLEALDDMGERRDTVAFELRSVCDKVHRMRGAIHGKDREIANLKEDLRQTQEVVLDYLADAREDNQIIQLRGQQYAELMGLVELQDRVILEHLTDREDLKAALGSLKGLFKMSCDVRDAAFETIRIIENALQNPEVFFEDMRDNPEMRESAVLCRLYNGLQDFAALAANSVPVTPEIDEDEEVHLDPIASPEARKDFGLDLPF